MNLTHNPSQIPDVTQDDRSETCQQLSEISEQLLTQARNSGATQAEVSCSVSKGTNVSVRMQQVDTIESTYDRGIVVTVYFGKRKGTASTADLQPSSLNSTVAHACAIARYTEDDPASGLADAELMAKHAIDFDLWHPWTHEPQVLIDRAMACEAAGLAYDAKITNSDTGFASSMQHLAVYANSHGFIGQESQTQHNVGCALIAGKADQMQRDSWYSAALTASSLDADENIGRTAAQRVLARLEPKNIATCQVPVVFTAQVARTLIGHFFAAISGGALYRKASFLFDHLGKNIFPEWFCIEENPHLHRGWKSSAFDGEGVATRNAPIIENGILQRYLLSSYSARRLGLASTANAGGVHNITCSANARDLKEILAQVKKGVLITECMGQGVNTVTGDYSRGASGFWVENGICVHPVDGITIAGNLKDMLASIEMVGADIDPRSSLHIGSVLLRQMTVAGAT